MQKHIVMDIVRSHHTKMIKEARSIDEKITSLQAESRRLWVEVQAMTSLVEKLEEMPNHTPGDER